MRRWCARRRWSFNWFSSWSRARIVFVWSNCSLTFVYSQLTLVSLDAFGGTEALPWVDVAHVGMAVTLAGCKRQKTKRKLKHLPQRRRWRRVGKLKFKHLLALSHSRSVLKSVQFLIAMTSLDFLLLELLCTFTNLKNHHYFHITCWNCVPATYSHRWRGAVSLSTTHFRSFTAEQRYGVHLNNWSSRRLF